MTKDLRQAFADLDADAITAAIDFAFPRAVACAVERHVADGTIAALGPEGPGSRTPPVRRDRG
jgi:hypothetical protein